MNDDLAITLKWWIQHANELESERDYLRKMANDLFKCCALLASEEGITDEEFYFLNNTQIAYEKEMQSE